MYSGRIIFKVLAKLKQFNLAILPASNHRNIPYIPNSLLLSLRTFAFDMAFGCRLIFLSTLYWGKHIHSTYFSQKNGAPALSQMLRLRLQ